MRGDGAMRVLHIQKTDGLGGCERQLLAVLPELERRGVDVQVCVLGAGRFERFTEPLNSAGIPTDVIRAGSHLNPWLVPALVRKLRRWRPDLVHTHLIHGDVYGQSAARLAGVPGVSTVHSVHDFYLRQPYRSATRLAGSLSRRTIAISRYVGSFLGREGIAPMDRIRVIHYGINADEWTPESAETKAARSALGFQAEDVVVGMASRLIEHKGHELAIDALARALPRCPRMILAVAGDGPREGDIRAYARSKLPEGSILFLGFLSDMRQFMAACDVVVFPTSPVLGEGFGLVALEAMAAGRPVVVTRVGALPEVVEQARTGFVVEPDDVEELSHRLLSLGTSPDLRARLGAAARERAVGDFNLGGVVDQLMTVYEEAT